MKSVGLGVMHNWIEGILQHHFQFRWIFEVPKGGYEEEETDDDEMMVKEVDRSGWLLDLMIKNYAKLKAGCGTTRNNTYSLWSWDKIQW